MSATRQHDEQNARQQARQAEPWVSGKSGEELLADLRHFLGRLRADPHAIPDRLRVAAIQLRLGRRDEALVHYEGVVRGYVALGQPHNALALCQRLLERYPDLQRPRTLIAELYAGELRRKGDAGAVAAPTPPAPPPPSTPPAVESVEEQAFDDETVERPLSGSTIRWIFRRADRRAEREGESVWAVEDVDLDGLSGGEDDTTEPTDGPIALWDAQPGAEEPILLTRPKCPGAPQQRPPDDDGAGDPVYLLTRVLSRPRS